MQETRGITVARSAAGTWGQVSAVVAAGLGVIVVATAGRGPTVLRALLALLLVGCIVVASRHRAEPQRRAGAAEGQTPWQHVARELERSRRHGRPMSLARIPMDTVARESPVRALPGRLTPALRATDLAWVQGTDVMLLLAESTNARTQHALGRVMALLPGRAHAAPVRVASFPEDGLTLTALCECLEGRRPLRRFASLAPSTGDAVDAGDVVDAAS